MILYLQQFLYQILNKEAINNQVNGVYYQVPANSSFPYIYIGDFNSKDISGMNQEIVEIHFKLVIYLRDKSLKSMLELSQEIKRVLTLNRKEKVALMRCVEEKMSLQNDGVTHQINMRFKAVLG